MRNRGLRLKLKIKYFCLEESKESFIQSIYCYKLYEQFGLRVPIKMLKSVKKSALPREIRDKVDALDGYMEEFEEYVEVIDDVKHAYGIYVNVQDYMEENGSWVMKNIPLWKKSADGKGGSLVITPVKDYYVPDNPDTYVEVITDHVSKLHPPKGKDLRETMADFSGIYCCDMRDRYQCSVINVHQQTSDQEKKQYTYAGQNIISKLEPSLDGLADNKACQRDKRRFYC